MKEKELDVEATIWVRIWVDENATETEIRHELKSTSNWHDWDIMDFSYKETGEYETTD
jgi:hypothetical protein